MEIGHAGAQEFLSQGRLAQSMAFFSPPGIERLYSGVNASSGGASRTSAVASFRRGLRL